VAHPRQAARVARAARHPERRADALAARRIRRVMARRVALKRSEGSSPPPDPSGPPAEPGPQDDGHGRPEPVSLAERRQDLGAPLIAPTRRHWDLFVQLSANVQGPLVSDAYLAALAIEHGCELITTDADFSRFNGLRWRHPLSA
jgi:hypothetical protein